MPVTETILVCGWCQHEIKDRSGQPGRKFTRQNEMEAGTIMVSHGICVPCSDEVKKKEFPK